MRRRLAPAAPLGSLALIGALGLLAASVASADSFSPVRLSISVSPIARLNAGLPITGAVSADPGVLDNHDGPLRLEVKLAPECGGSFQTTSGTALLDSVLSPEPTSGQAYSATAHGATGRPNQYGAQTVCAFVEDTGSGRVYANDVSVQIDVSRSCTVAAASYDAAAKALSDAQRQLRHTKGKASRRKRRQTVTRDQRTLSRDQRAGAAACGPGVAL